MAESSSSLNRSLLSASRLKLPELSIHSFGKENVCFDANTVSKGDDATSGGEVIGKKGNEIVGHPLSVNSFPLTQLDPRRARPPVITVRSNGFEAKQLNCIIVNISECL